MNDTRKALLALAASTIAMTVALAGCAPAKQAVTQSIKSVTVAAARRTTITVSLEYAARVKPHQEIVVSPKVAGRVAMVNVDVGQKVKAGEVLFTLETKDYESQVRQAKATLDSANANLTRTSDSSLSSQVLQAQSAVKQGQVQYDDVKDLYDRTQKLFTSGTASHQQLDNAKAKLDSASIALDTAKQNLALIQDKGGPQSTGVASSQVDQAQATLDLAESQLSNAIITSPITGVVSSRAVDAGELVSSAVPAIVVIDVSSLSAEASVDEDMVTKIHVGQVVPLVLDAAPGEKLEGRVETISPALDPRTQGYTVKIRVLSPPLAVKSGMLARARFPVDSRENALAVPNGAVVTETGVDYVYAVIDGTVKKLTVQTGISDDAVTQIAGGLQDGALVVTEGQSFLNDGEKVTVAQ